MKHSASAGFRASNRAASVPVGSSESESGTTLLPRHLRIRRCQCKSGGIECASEASTMAQIWELCDKRGALCAPIMWLEYCCCMSDMFLCWHVTAQGVKLEDMARELLAVGGPIANATRADAVRLHDDKVCRIRESGHMLLDGAKLRL